MPRSWKFRSPIWKLCWPSSASVLMRNALLFILGFLLANSLWADDLTRAIQQRLKDQGYYYGEVDGQGGDETSAAIRRFQIRSGLKVTGQTNDETLRSLGLSRSSAERPTPGYQENGRSSGAQPSDPYYQPPRQDEVQPLPEAEGPEDYNEMQRPPQFLAPRVLTSLPQLFSGTIYERSPAQIQ